MHPPSAAAARSVQVDDDDDDVGAVGASKPPLVVPAEEVATGLPAPFVARAAACTAAVFSLLKRPVVEENPSRSETGLSLLSCCCCCSSCWRRSSSKICLRMRTGETVNRAPAVRGVESLQISCCVRAGVAKKARSLTCREAKQYKRKNLNPRRRNQIGHSSTSFERTPRESERVDQAQDSAAAVSQSSSGRSGGGGRRRRCRWHRLIAQLALHPQQLSPPQQLR